MNPVILYNNFLEDGTLTVTSTESGYDKDNLLDQRPYTLWRATSSATQNIDLELVSAKKPTAIGIVNHNLFSIGATVKVQAYVASAWEDVHTFTPTADTAILELFTPDAVNTKWRINISGQSSEPIIGVIFLGTEITFPYPPETPYSPIQESIQIETEVSQKGHLLGNNIRYNPIQINASFKDLTRVWVNANFVPFWNNYGKLLKYFFYAWDLTNAASDIYYVRFSPEMVYQLPKTILLYDDQLNLNMIGVSE